MLKFEKIYLDLKRKIKDNTYPVGTFLPGEHQLAEYYKCSRETVRRALDILFENGYINKKRGKGNFVLDYKPFTLPVSGIVSYKELVQEQGLNSKTEVVKLEIVSAPQIVLDEIDISKGEKFVHIIRTREIDGQIVIVDEDYLRHSVVGDIPLSVAEDSVYEYLEEELGLVITHATKDIHASEADELDKKYLGIKEDRYVISVKSLVYLEDDTFFQYTHSHHKLEKFRFSEFARRKK